MKLRLTPELAYLVGMWYGTPYKKGLGIKGEQDIQEIFIEHVLSLGIAQPNQILVKKDGAYIQQTKYKKFFKEIMEERFIRFKYWNDYSAAFWAGVFDAIGGIENKMLYLSKFNEDDEVHLSILGFRTEKKQNKLFILHSPAFAFFIQHFVQKYKDDASFLEVVAHAKIGCEKQKTN
jgi:hypothetical protein